jgi:hypothetical protein
MTIYGITGTATIDSPSKILVVLIARSTGAVVATQEIATGEVFTFWDVPKEVYQLVFFEKDSMNNAEILDYVTINTEKEI